MILKLNNHKVNLWKRQLIGKQKVLNECNDVGFLNISKDLKISAILSLNTHFSTYGLLHNWCSPLIYIFKQNLIFYEPPPVLSL